MATIPETEWERYCTNHEAEFGHQPVRDLAGGALCVHPVHDDLRRLIDGPGVDLDVSFDPHEVLADDDPRVVRFHEDYDRAVETNRQWIAELEEDDDRRVRTHCTVGDHDVRRSLDPSGRPVLYCRRPGCAWRRWA